MNLQIELDEKTVELLEKLLMENESDDLCYGICPHYQQFIGCAENGHDCYLLKLLNAVEVARQKKKEAEDES